MAANLYKPRPTTSILRASGGDGNNGGANLRSLTPGSVVMGRYTIQKIIGRGGMATVYLAKNQETERLVALKILDPEISNDPSYVERFRREARAAGRIRSDHVVAIYDLGTDESGTLVLVMEYLEGQTVQQALRGGPLPLSRAMILGRQLFEGLAAAHENGVIHRDLKPANLFIEKLTGGSEKLKILDFGISKLAEVSSQELTRAGQTLGTLAYMAPEQIRGAVKGNDPRIDLYSAGVSLFLMFTAKRPIDAEDTVQLLQAVLEKPPLTLAQASGSEFHPSIEAFVARALVKDPTRRYQSAIEMRDALLQAARESGVDAMGHFAAPHVSVPPARQSAPPALVTPASGVAMTMEAAPSFTPPSGVIVSVDPSGPSPSAPLALPTFDDEEEEGKTVVRQPGVQAQNAEPASPLPLAGRRPTPAVAMPVAVPNAPTPQAPNVVRPPTMAPTGLAASGQPTIPPRHPTTAGIGPVSPLMPPDSPPTQAFDVFGPPPDGFVPPPQVNGNVPVMGLAPPVATTIEPPAPQKRSPLKMVLVAAVLMSGLMFTVAGVILVRRRPAHPTDGAVATVAATSDGNTRGATTAVALPAPTVTQESQPTPAAATAPGPIAQPLNPTTPPSSEPAQPVVARQPVTPPVAVPETPHESTNARESRDDRASRRDRRRVGATAAEVDARTPRAVRTPPESAATARPHPPRPPRTRTRTGIITADPFGGG